MNETRSTNPMEGGGDANTARGRTSSPFQFSIFGLLGLMTCVGVATGLLFAVPPWIGGRPIHHIGGIGKELSIFSVK